MKKIIMVMATIALFAACKKSDNSTPNNGNNNNNTNTDYTNTITIVDNGTSYKANGANDIGNTPHVHASLDTSGVKYGKNAEFYVNIEGDAYPIKVEFFGEHAGSAMLGTYTKKYPGYSMTEQFSGGQQYNIDSVSIDITSWDNTTTKGSFILFLKNTSGTKTVTGTMDCKTVQVI